MRKNTCKKIYITLATAMMLGVIAGCSNPISQQGNTTEATTISQNNDNKTEVTDSTEEVETTEITTEATTAKEENDTVEPTIVESENNPDANSEAMAAIKEIWDKAVEYVKNEDEEGFYSNLFVNGEKGEWDDDFKSIRNFLNDYFMTDENPRIEFQEIFESGNYYLMVVKGYSKSQYEYKTIPITCIDGKWLIDRTSESYKKKDEKMYSYVPEGYIEAKDSGRNVYINDWSLVWMNTSIYVPGQFRTPISLMWQNADGSVDVLMNVQNGKDEDKQVTKWRMFVSSDNNEKIFDINYDGDGTVIPPKTAKNMLVHIKKEDVKTGMAEWNVDFLSISNSYR